MSSGTAVANKGAVMRTVSWIAYVVLLVAAFAIGMIGTVAAGRALLHPASDTTPASVDQPTQMPIGAPESAPLPTVEC